MLFRSAPVPAIQHVDAKEPVNLLSLSAQQMEALRKAVPEFLSSKIPAGTYLGLNTDYITVAVPNFGVGRVDLPDELVYRLTKAVFENQPRLAKRIAEARDTLAQNVVTNTFLPFHPGRSATIAKLASQSRMRWCRRIDCNLDRHSGSLAFALNDRSGRARLICRPSFPSAHGPRCDGA